ncbi:MAG: OsmC family protein [Alphaproteobacteria bacterium]
MAMPTKVPMRVSATCPTVARSDVRIRDFSLVIDEPVVRHGQDSGPTPMEVLMASLAGCSNVILNKICAERGVKLEDVSIDIVGMLDVRGINGQERIKTAFPEVRLAVTCTAHTTPETMAAIREELAWRCPASVVLRSQGAEFQETWNVTYR